MELLREMHFFLQECDSLDWLVEVSDLCKYTKNFQLIKYLRAALQTAIAKISTRSDRNIFQVLNIIFRAIPFQFIRNFYQLINEIKAWQFFRY